MVASVEFLRTVAGVNGKTGAVGFCWGGGICNMLATRIPDLGASVPFYGSGSGSGCGKDQMRILQLHYASNDERINAGWPAYEAALKEAKVTHEAHTYPEHAARVPQRHHTALRRNGSQAGVDAYGGVFRKHLNGRRKLAAPIR